MRSLFLFLVSMSGNFKYLLYKSLPLLAVILASSAANKPSMGVHAQTLTHDTRKRIITILIFSRSTSKHTHKMANASSKHLPRHLTQTFLYWSNANFRSATTLRTSFLKKTLLNYPHRASTAASFSKPPTRICLLPFWKEEKNTDACLWKQTQTQTLA